ncbi:carbohydrate ABC transporter permease [Anaerococcus sp. WCA-380-WT-2B]|uniref:Carbohydrate ABC transporter permease n=1 Tax=Anaerococcus porci TaxID=2652269 RepID=A0A6N7VRZ9_9FIRM|nr:carbohydrate ABC transporter permease [Anaerococcus porci]MSS77646.1 carbohydrate ABC transporter permease [Anaerococcus porci]
MKKIGKLFQYIFVILMAIITLFPFVYMILSSVMTYQEVISIPPTLIPKGLNFKNYSEAMKVAPFARYFLNTIFVTSINTIATLITTTLAAFALNFMNFKYKNALQTFLISLLMIPFEIVVFTNFRTIANIKLIDTYLALILPFMASVYYIFYLKQFLNSIPKEYYNVAKVDGASDFEFIRKVMIPMSKSNLFTIGLLNFITGWNSFLWPILVTNSKEMRMISNGLSAFATEAGSLIHLQMAASTITILPILILYFLFRKRILEGVSYGGIKG